MPAIVDSPRRGTSSTVIHFQAITRQAEKQVEKLSLPDRLKVGAILRYGNDSRQNGPLSSRILHDEALARTGCGTGRGLSV